MQSFKNFKSDNTLDFFYPPILDKDAAFAARFLSIEDTTLCYDALKSLFLDLNGDSLVILRDTVFSSKANFRWFKTFFKELERILEKEPIKIGRKAIIPEGDLEFQPPFHRSTSGKVIYDKIGSEKGDIIEKHRAKYIYKQYVSEDFYEGYPIWYSLSNTTVFEKYDAKTNHRVRIDYNNGEFFYFLSGASDNWQQIIDVPIEIDYVVASILFRTMDS